MLGEAGVSASRNQNLKRPRRGRRVSEERQKRVAELRPLSVPLEGVVAASESEELVPILFAGEVFEGLQEVISCVCFAGAFLLPHGCD